MFTRHSISFVGSLNQPYRAERVACATGVQTMSTPLCFAEPLRVARQSPDAHHTASSQNGVMLTIEQRMRIDMFLAPFQTWTVGAAAEDGSWQVTSCFAPRLHRNGDIDFIAPYLAGSHAFALVTAHPVVTFLVSDGEAGRWLEGRAQTVVIQRSWEHAELLSYLRWRIPDATDGLSGAIEVVVFRPTYLHYCDRASGGGVFEVKW